jgi:hypothetical protein
MLSWTAQNHLYGSQGVLTFISKEIFWDCFIPVVVVKLLCYFVLLHTRKKYIHRNLRYRSEQHVVFYNFGQIIPKIILLFFTYAFINKRIRYPLRCFRTKSI